ncbi:YajQ family cyclic di-GMP-binding protein [Alphaproteobacteria bacterium]|nr:YajQ family cyclic di-GMP-binding protein [Alphaproteobacteria bacterium]
MPTFDVVSRLDLQEIDNAVSNVLREIKTRYDFKGSETTLERKEHDLTVVTDDDLKLRQVNDLIVTHFVRRKVDPLCLEEGNKEKAGGDKVRQVYKLNEGIEQVIAKKITSDIKSSKIKVQVKVNGNELRVDGKKKDDLQAVMKMIEEAKIGIPIQFINFRD